MGLASRTNITEPHSSWMCGSLPSAINDRATPPLRAQFHVKICHVVFCSERELGVSLTSLSQPEKVWHMWLYVTSVITPTHQPRYSTDVYE